jgi:methionyl-tRNA formyltransferase
MVIKILGSRESAAFGLTAAIIRRLGHAVYDDSYFYCDLALAPLLTDKLTSDDIEEPIQGTLIFHPSPLPYGRGASSIRWAYRRGEPITAATWFWATDKMDAGDICEMEILKIDYTLSPKLYYESHVLPALERTLKRALNDIARGVIRRVPQVEGYATFDKKL